MALSVTLPFDLALETYWAILNKPGISQELAWELRQELDDSACDILSAWSDSELRPVVDILKSNTLEEAIRDHPLVGDATEIVAIWWTLHRGLLDPESLRRLASSGMDKENYLAHRPLSAFSNLTISFRLLVRNACMTKIPSSAVHI